MKRFLLFIFVSISACLIVTANDESEFRNFVIENIGEKYTGSNGCNIIKIQHLQDSYNLAVYKYYDDEISFFISDGKRKINESSLISTKKNKFNSKYLIKIEGTDTLIGDFCFNETIGIMYFSINEFVHNNSIKIKTIQKNCNYFDKEIFQIEFPAYKYKRDNDSDEYFIYKGSNPRINEDFYISLNDIRFVIINGKRGILINAIGDVYSEDAEYKMNIAKTDKSNWSFFYWSSSEQRYILDESVTQEQISNAYCPEDYFAYNGLKFSKLDSRLTDEDLKDLDKAQLRLMRNAVYARHGRTFKSVDLQSLFDCYTWYKKNPDYSDVLLNETDKYNISLIQSYESKK